MKRNILNSPGLVELKKHRHNVFLKKILVSVCALLVIFASLAYISRTQQLKISAIKVSGNKSIDTKVIETIIQKDIMDNYLFLFPKTNILIYPKNAIKKNLLNEFKRLKDVVLSINNGILEVSVSERIALYTWCGNTPSEITKDNQKCYFLDDSGYIFDEAPYFSGEVYFKFYGKIPQDFTKFISFKRTLEDMKLKPVALYTENGGDMRVFLSKPTSTQIEPEIILKIDSDFQKVAENLETALNTEPLLSNFKNKYSFLLYIDLRFGNKVYYKFK